MGKSVVSGKMLHPSYPSSVHLCSHFLGRNWKKSNNNPVANNLEVVFQKTEWLHNPRGPA